MRRPSNEPAGLGNLGEGPVRRAGSYLECEGCTNLCNANNGGRFRRSATPPRLDERQARAALAPHRLRETANLEARPAWPAGSKEHGGLPWCG
jgi:hypothetical protein